MCTDDQYFDPNTDNCEDKPDSSEPCFDDNEEPVTGVVASPFYCRYYYVCDNGTSVSVENCAMDEIFSQDDNECIPDDGSCISIGYCF